MTPDIERIAREAGIEFDELGYASASPSELESFAYKIVRECAYIARHTVCDTHLPTGVRIYGTAAAKTIRERFGA